MFQDSYPNTYILFVCLFFLQIAYIMLISSGVDISNVNSCELKSALDFIKLNYTSHPCQNNAIKQMSGELLGWGIGELCLNTVLFISILCTCLWQFSKRRVILVVLFICVSNPFI